MNARERDDQNIRRAVELMRGNVPPPFVDLLNNEEPWVAAAVIAIKLEKLADKSGRIRGPLSDALAAIGFAVGSRQQAAEVSKLLRVQGLFEAVGSGRSRYYQVKRTDALSRLILRLQVANDVAQTGQSETGLSPETAQFLARLRQWEREAADRQTLFATAAGLVQLLGPERAREALDLLVASDVSPSTLRDVLYGPIG